MPYNKTTWVNDEEPALNATNLNKIEDGVDDATEAIEAHIADATDAHDASAISFSPTGTISATTVQGAIAEVAAEGGGGGGSLSDGDKGDITVSSSGTVWTIDNGAVTAAKVAADVATQAELDAEAALARNADNLTSGTVADARIASTIARDSEVTAAIATHAAALDPHGDRAYADGLIAAADAMVFKGVIDCSVNPNYPAANAGWTYRVSVAGKIGGGSGTVVEAGDILLCLTDNTVTGTQAAVGSSWGIIQTNLAPLATVATTGAYSDLTGKPTLGTAAATASTDYVHSTGNESVSGVKTFTSSPVVPAPTTDLQAATKKYADDAVAAEALLARDATNLTSGIIPDDRISATIARDSEITTAISSHTGSTDPHGDREYTDTHISDTTAAHAASAISFIATGTIAATNVQTAVAEVASEAANADNLTSGTVADARIPSTIARDSEVTSAVAAEATLARNADNLTSGTIDDARIPSTITRDAEAAAAYAPIAHVTNSGAHSAANISFASTVGIEAITVQAAIEEVAAEAGSGGSVADGAVTTAKIADAAVTTAKIADASVTTAKLADTAVTTAKITDANVTTAKIADGAVTAAKVAADVATQAELDAVASAAANASNLTSGTVDDARIPSGIARDSEVTSAVAAEATLARNADNLTSGTVADARIASTIARDSEVTAAVDAEALLARNADNLTSGTVADARIASTIARDSEVTSAVAAEATLARDASNLTSGTVAEARIHADIARDSEVTGLIAAEATARDTAIATAIAALVASAPGLLDTLDELAAALGDDPNFATTMTTALAGKQPLHANLTALAAIVGEADKLPYFSGLGAISVTTFTTFARSMLDDTDASGVLSTLGVSTFIKGLLDDADAATALSTLGAAAIESPALTGTPTAPTAAQGTNSTQIATTAMVQSEVSLLAPKANPALTGTPTAPTAAQGTDTTQIATTAMVQSEVTLLAPKASPTFTGTVAGITKSMVGLGNVDNTSDANKPVSTAQQTALDLKANLASPTFTGTPSLSATPAAGNNSTQIATTAFVYPVAPKVITLACTDPLGTALVATTGVAYTRIPDVLDAWKITSIGVHLVTAGQSTGATTVSVHKISTAGAVTGLIGTTGTGSVSMAVNVKDANTTTLNTTTGALTVLQGEEIRVDIGATPNSAARGLIVQLTLRPA